MCRTNGLVEAHATFFSYDQLSRERELLTCFYKEAFNIGLRSDAYEPISFKQGMMLEMTKLFVLIPVWITLTLPQGHRIMTKLVQSFCCKVAWSCPICDDWSCWEMTAKKSCKLKGCWLFERWALNITLLVFAFKTWPVGISSWI